MIELCTHPRRCFSHKHNKPLAVDRNGMDRGEWPRVRLFLCWIVYFESSPQFSMFFDPLFFSQSRRISSVYGSQHCLGLHCFVTRFAGNSETFVLVCLLMVLFWLIFMCVRSLFAPLFTLSCPTQLLPLCFHLPTPQPCITPPNPPSK